MEKLSTTDIHQYLPMINDPELIEKLAQEAHIESFQDGEVLMQKGTYIKNIPIVLKGSIRILREDEEGKEVFLYYLKEGESCALSLTCCSNNKPSEIKAVSDGDTQLLMLPVHMHQEWMNAHKQWKDFVSMTYQSRFEELLHAIDAIAFKKMDERILNYLVAKFKQHRNTELQLTHQELATELGTSREVVSRLLKQLEKRKVIELGRNKIYVRDDFDTRH